MAGNEGQVGEYFRSYILPRKDKTTNHNSSPIDLQEWEAKAAKAKDDYDRAVKEFEANGGSSAANGGAKKRAKPAKKASKKSKKDESDEDDDDESE